MHPTPDLSHLTTQDFQHVYEPAEDTFILLDALEADAQRLVSFRPFICLEIGSGSGCVSVFIQQLLRSISTLHFCTDINQLALKATASTFSQNALPQPNVIQTSLVECLRLDQTIELLLFNPPYVETEDEEYEVARGNHKISASWAGGSDGMKLTNQLLENLERILHPQRGILYIVAIKENKPDEIVKRMEDAGFVAVIVMKRRAGREHLHVLRISRPSAHAILMGN
ncbi:S-adenosylmethionine-dependent methyltransferase [Puccinia graminis f. sp. tritici]|uniref:S-adenosylmethionine-dependent methyltransferase n=1 Tax=Puccinia graminis f. sp. tritici TaxID=56615 RepID=A0A5B0RXB9_PUCGR|nr:S-adenosylmethionine-dependent methyltransferase [Puccinia graminis f. sp. tritici]